jgi:Protein of unknown function (DUF2630)
MKDQEILVGIGALVEEERRLRAHGVGGGGLSDEDRARLRDVEERLDQCWDLLRQRRAREEFGENPDEAITRSTNEVESYRQ